METNESCFHCIYSWWKKIQQNDVCVAYIWGEKVEGKYGFVV